VAFDVLVKKAEALGDARALRELREVGPPPYPRGQGYGVQRRWSNFFEGADSFIASMFGFALHAPGYSVRDVNDWLAGQMLSAEQLVPATSALTAADLGGTFALPVFVIQGAEDFTTPTSLARSFVDSIRAPAKAKMTPRTARRATSERASVSSTYRRWARSNCRAGTSPNSSTGSTSTSGTRWRSAAAAMA